MQKFARHNIHHINKENFLLIYIKIKTSVFIEQTIKNEFLVTRFVPVDFDCVLLSFKVVNYKTPLLFMTLQEVTWMSKMLHTIIQLKKQACFIKEFLQHQFQSFSNRAVNQFIKNCQITMHSVVVLVQENKQFQTVN